VVLPKPRQALYSTIKLNTYGRCETGGYASDEIAKARAKRNWLQRQHQSNRDHCNNECVLDYLGAVLFREKFSEHGNVLGEKLLMTGDKKATG
jgi:hypothetical protein